MIPVLNFRLFKRLILIIGLFAVCCTPSLTYSPSIHLPAQPLKKRNAQAMIGIGMLVESRPQFVDKPTAQGREIILRYGVSDYFTLQFKGWKDYSSNVKGSRSGVAYSNLILLNSEEALFKIGFLPTGAFLFDDDGLGGGGGIFPVCIWLPAYKIIHPYFAIGPGIGIRDLTEGRRQWGWGVILNVGASLQITRHLSTNIEVARIKQVNVYENRTDYLFTPSFTAGYNL